MNVYRQDKLSYSTCTAICLRYVVCYGSVSCKAIKRSWKQVEGMAMYCLNFIVLSDQQAFGPSGLRTNGPSDQRTNGPSD